MNPKAHTRTPARNASAALIPLVVTLLATQLPISAAEPTPNPQAHKVYPTFGKIERNDHALDTLIPANASLEKLAEGFAWSEGPQWIHQGEYLVFSDVPNNVIFKWKEGVGTRELIYPSGYTGSSPRKGEPGSNGITLDPSGHLVFCQHGDRRIVRMEKSGNFTPLAEFHLHRRFNSPNDLVFNRAGDLYFTDPPYGLEGNNADPRKELLYNGVYLRRRNGEITLLTDKLTFPNGLAFSPDERILYVAVSDPKQALIMAYDVQQNGTIANGRVFFDATPLIPGREGLPDGLKVDHKGNLFATGPGGILILSPEGRHLGTINTGQPTANCAFGGKDGSTLYITANHILCRIQTTTRGAGIAK